MISLSARCRSPSLPFPPFANSPSSPPSTRRTRGRAACRAVRNSPWRKSLLNKLDAERERRGGGNQFPGDVCVRTMSTTLLAPGPERGEPLTRSLCSALLSTEGEPACDPRFVTMESVWGVPVRGRGRRGLNSRKGNAKDAERSAIRTYNPTNSGARLQVIHVIHVIQLDDTCSRLRRNVDRVFSGCNSGNPDPYRAAVDNLDRTSVRIKPPISNK